MKNITFNDPAYLWFLLIVPAILVFYFFRHKKSEPSLTITGLEPFRHISFLAANVKGSIIGFGLESYRLAIESFLVKTI